MKAIILISSIFYILGLKIGNKIDLVKKSHPVDKVITEKAKVEKPSDCYDATNEIIKKEESDTTKGGSTYSDAILKPIEF
ncbi:hypothetical protein N9164_05365 [Draconibacterium sp.]|nr:hypothetical protein [Draconibacterium sp.]